MPYLELINVYEFISIGIAEDVLVEVAGFMYPIGFVILEIEENEYMPLILGTLFLTTARADIRCSDGSMTLRASKFKILEWEERIEKCKEDETEFGKWKNKVILDEKSLGALRISV
ncbi:zf-CCHC domain-containing protein [Tanacetum coccineum]